jgi:hypothetical protein
VELAWRISSFAISNQICRLPGIPSRVIISESWYKTTLIPSATNGELKSLLETGLKIFEGHQHQAEKVTAALK